MSDEDKEIVEEDDETQEEQEQSGPTTWDEYVASLPEDQQEVVAKLYADKNQALLNTVKATRDERDEFAGKLREAARKEKKGSDAEKLYTEQADQLEQANKRADFYEDAPNHECKNPKAAYKIAVADSLFTKKGLPDWDAIKETAPELFGAAVEPERRPRGKGGAGEGTDRKPAAPISINDMIRQQAGVTPQSEE